MTTISFPSLMTQKTFPTIPKTKWGLAKKQRNIFKNLPPRLSENHSYLLQTNTKLQQLQEQQRDLELTKSRMRVIEGIKNKAELRKQQELLMQNAAMVARCNSCRAFGKTVLPRSQTRAKTKKAEMDALEAAAREERIANLESIMLDMMGRKSAETSTKKVRKGKARNFSKKVVSEDGLQSSSSDEKSQEESSEESEQEKKPKRKHSKKPKKPRKNKSPEEKKYGTLDSFIKSLRK